jgi:hypothetical protein
MKAKEILKSIKDKGLPLTARSADFMFITDPSQIAEFVNTNKNSPLLQQV